MIDRERANKHCVYVHCKAGKGRSATVVACYVIKVCFEYDITLKWVWAKY